MCGQPRYIGLLISGVESPQGYVLPESQAGTLEPGSERDPDETVTVLSWASDVWG